MKTPQELIRLIETEESSDKVILELSQHIEQMAQVQQNLVIACRKLTEQLVASTSMIEPGKMADAIAALKFASNAMKGIPV